MAEVYYPVNIIITYLWIGFVCAISFMEAGLKFRAPGITLPLGLGIGQLVFKALHRTEWVMVVILLFNILLFGLGNISWKLIWFLLPDIMLIVQSIWTLPALNRRATLIIKGQQLPSSNLHYYYVGLDLIKIMSLFAFGILQFQ